jgi:pimeloyl-ACP methyl ester carboxylesterase
MVSGDHDPLASTMVLADGRQLGFAEWSPDASGPVVLDFHGGPGCRLSVSVDIEDLRATDIRWISVDRPGLGLSWPKPHRTVAAWAHDVAELVNHLDVDKFSVCGWSMGGPYAAACAALLPDRVTSLTLLAPAPVTLPGPEGAERMGKSAAWVLARDDPWAMAELYTVLGLEARRDPDLAVDLFRPGLSDSELAALGTEEVRTEFIATIIEATRQGSVGLVEDLRVEMQPWGFDPGTVQAPGWLWQGDDDSFVTPADNAPWLELIPKLQAHALPGEGHLFNFGHTPEILDEILQIG